jgi:uncharacterized protein (TIGR02265 family)
MDTPGRSGPPQPPLGSDEELQQRLSLVAPTHTMRGLFFNSVLEVVRSLGDETAVQRCLAASGETKFQDLASYPTSTFLRMLYTAGKLLSVRFGSFEGALRPLGSRTMMKFLASAAGKALQGVAEDDPQRLIANIPLVHRMVLMGGDCTVKSLGSNRSLLVIERISTPAAFIEGALQMTLEAARVRGVRVTSRQTGPLDAEFEVSWT